MNRAPAELSIIVPTFNESGNIRRLVEALSQCLGDTAWEVIFVDDDSADQTAEQVRRIARSDARVRCLQRIGRRGLSTAVVEGMLSSSAPYLAVMDGDLQHDETLLPEMLRVLKADDTDIVIGSRFCAGGGIGDWSQSRARISRFAAMMSRIVVKAELSDPMSGFFMIRRDAFERAMRRLSGLGYKILIDLFASSKTPLRFRELPYSFRTRTVGESKLDTQVAWDYAMLIADKAIGRIIPVRFMAFGLIGGFGVLVHLATFVLLFKTAAVHFMPSQLLATIAAMVFNYSLNNRITYRDSRRKGLAWYTGLMSFMLACSIGAISNVGIATYLFNEVSGWLPAALAGIVVGAVWNFAVTKTYTWKNA